MSMKVFAKALSLHDLTIDDARNASRLSIPLQRHVRWAQEYTLGEAERRRKERELYGNRMPEDEFWAIFDHPDWPYVNHDEVIAEVRANRMKGATA